MASTTSPTPSRAPAPPVTHPDRSCATARPSLFAIDGPRPWAKAQVVSFAYCQRCPFQFRCFDWAVTSGARSIVAGGAYFDERGRVYLFRNGIAS